MLGIAAYIRASHASLSDYDLVLYDSGGTALKTINVDVSVSYNTTASYQYVVFGFSSAYTLTADTTYYIFAKPLSTAQTIQMPVFDDYPAGGGAHIAQCGAASLKYAYRNDGGSITTDDTKMAPISPIVDFATGASGGSGFIGSRALFPGIR